MTLLQAVDGDVDDTLFAFADNLGGLELVSSGDVLTAVANGTCKITTSVGGDDFECVVRVNISG